MRLTEKTFFPLLSGIAPPDIKHVSRVMSLASVATENDHHLFHHRLSAATQVQRLRLCQPFPCHAACFIDDDFSTELAWDYCASNGSLFMHSACPPPSTMLPPGADLP